MTAYAKIIDRMLEKVSFIRIFTKCLSFKKIMVNNLWTVHKDEMKYSESKGSFRV